MFLFFWEGEIYGWVGAGFQDRGYRSISVADLGGSSIVLKLEEPLFCQDNNGKWVWSAYHNNKKEPPFGLLDPPPQSHTILGKEVDRSGSVTHSLHCLHTLTLLVRIKT